MPADPDEFDYLRRVELLARELVACAGREGWLSYEPDPEDATPLQRAANQLARVVRHYHFEGDGCLEEGPTLSLGGASLVKPGSQVGDYAELCERLGVEARSEGWALWHTWESRRRTQKLTLVTTRLATTEGLLANWSRRVDVHPVIPDRGQVAALVRGWVGPSVLSPDHARELGFGGA